MDRKSVCIVLLLAACGGGKGTGDSGDDDGSTDAATGDGAPLGTGPQLAGCPVLPSNHVFNTPIASLPVDPNSDAYIATIGGTDKLHLDLGTDTDQTAADFYGIPYNVVHGNSLTWPTAAYYSSDPSLDWDPTQESDCGNTSHAVVTPCTAAPPILPIPASPIVEGGIDTATNEMPYGDHHLLLLDADACRLWELYHVYSPTTGTWNIFGSAEFDLTSNALRPAGWTSADAAGFPMLPLLLKADEASSGTIAHALRFTIESSSIRNTYNWPARHLTSNGTSSTSLPPMGQLFRLKASFQIPTTYNTQSIAILTAMKTYGMYIADGGSNMYVSGVSDASWADDTFSQVQSVAASNFEAVDITAITSRPGWNVDSGAVP